MTSASKVRPSTNVTTRPSTLAGAGYGEMSLSTAGSAHHHSQRRHERRLCGRLRYGIAATDLHRMWWPRFTSPSSVPTHCEYPPEVPVERKNIHRMTTEVTRHLTWYLCISRCSYACSHRLEISVSSGRPPHPSAGTDRKPLLIDSAVDSATCTARYARSMPVSPVPTTSTRFAAKSDLSLYSLECRSSPVKSPGSGGRCRHLVDPSTQTASNTLDEVTPLGEALGFPTRMPRGTVRVVTRWPPEASRSTRSTSCSKATSGRRSNFAAYASR